MVGEQPFSKGSVAEVSSDEEGFKDAWYVATVIEPPSKSASKKKKQLLVEYQTLVSDDDGFNPLREYVDASFLRPLPPPLTDQSFELNDVVDAYHRDGWWTGVITKVFEEDSRFLVFFQNPPDEIEFFRSDLRFRQEWVDGKWVRPGKKRTTGLIFSTGTAVEANLDKENCDVWFPAIVLEEIRDNYFLVEYQSSRIDDEGGLLKVTVDSLHIRPSPPRLEGKNFELLEKVDAFYDFGWWSGVITKLLTDRRYIVFFKHSNKEMEFSHSELRPHMGWIDEKWVSASQEVLITSEYQEQLGHASNNASNTEMAIQLEHSGAAKDNAEEKTPCSLNSRKNQSIQTELSTPCNEKSPSDAITSSKKKTKPRTPYHDATSSRPWKKLKQVNAAEARKSLTASQIRVLPIETSTKESLCGFSTPTVGGAGTNWSKQTVIGDQPSAKTGSHIRGKKLETKQQKVGGLDNQTTVLVKKRGRPPKSQQAAAVEEGNAGGDAAEVIVEKECIMKEIDMSECKGMRGSQAENSHQLPNDESLKLMRDQEKHLNDPAKRKSLEIKQQTDGGVSNHSKRRGRPPKLLGSSSKASAAGNNGAGGAAGEMVVKGCTMNVVELPTITGLDSTGMTSTQAENLLPLPKKDDLKLLITDQKRLLSDPVRHKNLLSNIMKKPLAKKEKRPRKRVVQVLGKQREKLPSKRGRSITRNGRGRSITRNGRGRSITRNLSPPIQVFQDASREKAIKVFETEHKRNEVETAIPGTPSNMSDDQPLSMWFEGMHSPTVDDSRVSPGRTVNQCTEANDIRGEFAMQSPAIDATGECVPDENRSLPFMKSSLIWKTIESMEVFQMLPQKPHFRPLSKCKEECREGLAIGSMVTFASLVEKTSKLQFDDPRSIIDSSLEALLDLEIHGFGVKAVRDRLNELLSIKDRQGQLERQSKEVESQIMEHNHETTKIDEEIDEIDKKIRELEGKRALAMLMKESKGSEIATLRSSVDVINEGIRSIPLDFERLVVAPW